MGKIHLIFPCVFDPCFYFSLVQSLRCLGPLFYVTQAKYFFIFLCFSPSQPHPPRTPKKKKKNLVPKSTTSVALVVHLRPRDLIEFRCVVTVSTPAVWLARENIKRLTPGPCINVEYSHRVVYMEETTSVFHSGQYGRPSIPIIYNKPLLPNDSPSIDVSEQRKQPPYLARDTISEILHDLPGKTAIHQS